MPTTVNVMEVAAYLGYLAAGIVLLAFWPGPDDTWTRVDTVGAAATVAVAASVLWVGSAVLRGRGRNPR